MIVVTVVVTVEAVEAVEAVLEVEVIQAMEDKGIHSLLRKAIVWPTALMFKLFRTSYDLPPGRSKDQFSGATFRARSILLIRVLLLLR